jgi:hypothetical protein
VLVDWRSRDLERGIAAGRPVAAPDVTWLLAELRQARSALTEIVALAHDLEDSSSIALRIRIAASHALGLYDAGTTTDGSD